MTPPRRKPVSRRRAPRSRAGKLAVLAVSVSVSGGAGGWVCARLIMLLADVRFYMGWYWMLALVGGIVAAIAPPWVVVRGGRSAARWPGWLLVGYVAAVFGGMRYYLSLRFTPPGGFPLRLPPPSPWFVLQIAGLFATTLVLSALDLLLLAVMVEVAAPGPVGGWLRTRRTRRVRPNRHPEVAEERFRFHVRLRLDALGGPAGPWLPGAIRVRPGSLLWEPAEGIQGVPLPRPSRRVLDQKANPGSELAWYLWWS